MNTEAPDSGEAATTRKLGHVPDYPVHYDEDGGAHQNHSADDYLLEDSKILGTAKLAGAGSIDWSHVLDSVQDQRGGTCVGQSCSSSIYMRAQIQKRPIKRPSPTLIVAIAQMSDAPGKPIDCDGCRPSVAVARLRDRGVVPIEFWPETDENLVTIPDESIFARAEGAKVDAYYRVPTASDVIKGLREALARGYLPIFGMSVDARYENIGTAVYDLPGGKVLGNHAQTIVGFSAILNAFKVLNSWGTSFGDGGFSWIAAPFVARSTFDRLVIESTPTEV